MMRWSEWIGSRGSKAPPLDQDDNAFAAALAGVAPAPAETGAKASDESESAAETGIKRDIVTEVASPTAEDKKPGEIVQDL